MRVSSKWERGGKSLSRLAILPYKNYYQIVTTNNGDYTNYTNVVKYNCTWRYKLHKLIICTYRYNIKLLQLVDLSTKS